MRTNQDCSEEYQCQMFNCTKSFKTKSMLEQHIWHHVGSRPFLCQICGISYKAEYALIAHQVQKHSGEKQDKPITIKGYVCCNICLAMIPVKEKKEHVLIHIPTADIEHEVDESY